MAITGTSSPDTAKFFLDSCKNDISAAIDSYYANPGQAPVLASAAGPSAASAPDTIPKPNVKITAHGSQDEEEQRWYTGGGAGSGQEVIAPGQRGPSNVDDVFKAAQDLGARHETSEDNESKKAFTGAARTLDGGVIKAEEKKKIVIKFYENGIFTVDDGPPRGFADPSNHAFMDAISRGECPDELANRQTGSGIEVSLMKVGEDYKEPEKPKHVAFQGAGQRLGGTSAASTSAVPPTSDLSGWSGPDLDKPCTSIQLRLTDGTRLVAKFNNSQQVSDIRRFLASARPDLTSSYTMLTGFPLKPIADESQTFEDAGLLNAVITLK